MSQCPLIIRNPEKMTREELIAELIQKRQDVKQLSCKVLILQGEDPDSFRTSQRIVYEE